MRRFFNPPDVWNPFSAFSMGGGRTAHLKDRVPRERFKEPA